MSVRAKFRVHSVTKNVSNEETAFNVMLYPVTADTEENKQYWKWTPNGQIQLTTINAKAAEQFEVGKEYYVDFTKA